MAARVELIEIRFATHYRVCDEKHVVAISGSCESLGAWKPEQVLLLKRQDAGDWWEGAIMLPLSVYFEWKIVIYDEDRKQVVRWEERENRWKWVDRGPIEITVWWNMDELTQCTLMECKYLHCHCFTPYSNMTLNHRDLVTLIFITHFRYMDPGHTLAISGSGPYLGNWNPTLARQFDKTASSQHYRLTLTILMPVNESVEWKFVLLNRRYRTVIAWEDRENRRLETEFPESGVIRRRMTVGANWNENSYKTTKTFKAIDELCKCNVSSANNGKQETAAPTLSETAKLLSNVVEKGSALRSVHFLDNPVSEVHRFAKDMSEGEEDQLCMYLNIPRHDVLASEY